MDTIKKMCEGFRMELDDESFGQLVEWKLWQLHRAATRKLATGGTSRDQSRDQSGGRNWGQKGGESRGGSERVSGETIGGTSKGASGGESGKTHESESALSKQPAYDPVRDFE